MELKLGTILRHEMKTHGLTLKALEEMTGVPASTLSEWCQNRSPRNIVQVRKIADFLGVSIHYLLFGKADTHEHPTVSQLLKDDVFSGVFEISIKKVKINDRNSK